MYTSINPFSHPPSKFPIYYIFPAHRRVQFENIHIIYNNTSIQPLSYITVDVSDWGFPFFAFRRDLFFPVGLVGPGWVNVFVESSAGAHGWNDDIRGRQTTYIFIYPYIPNELTAPRAARHPKGMCIHFRKSPPNATPFIQMCYGVSFYVEAGLFLCDFFVHVLLCGQQVWTWEIFTAFPMYVIGVSFRLQSALFLDHFDFCCFFFCFLAFLLLPP